MDIETYRKNRERRLAEEVVPRELCTSCFQPALGCYCKVIRRFDPKIQFVILIHPIEVRRRIATGRMSHLCLENSLLVRGKDYSSNRVVNSIIQDSKNHSVVLYPGAGSIDVSKLDQQERKALFPENKKLAVFVIDGTWATARQMMRSENLARLPRICYTPNTPSRFRVRKQPDPNCHSTIEAVHQTIELLGESKGFLRETRTHDNLLEVFDTMVERQLEFVRDVRSSRHSSAG